MTVCCLLVNENLDSLESTYHSEKMSRLLDSQPNHFWESPFA